MRQAPRYLGSDRGVASSAVPSSWDSKNWLAHCRNFLQWPRLHVLARSIDQSLGHRRVRSWVARTLSRPRQPLDGGLFDSHLGGWWPGHSSSSQQTNIAAALGVLQGSKYFSCPQAFPPAQSFVELTNAGWYLGPARPNIAQPCRPTVAPAASTRLRPIYCPLGALTSHPQRHPVRSQSRHRARGHLCRI